ncbi:ammonium transporter [Phenylobacterium sp. LH3H17]|uniref:ammonium transporter n=1 Tax=Phenylobacterium sp. LH3H17 TaxID=2903901 RepID=UPI0020C992D4|nr:ammonium transporter [Phenylobacterium sp. LH3H17]UTP39560.1 ammonium transporter [Phenylobacterium sp. LH3H17]
MSYLRRVIGLITLAMVATPAWAQDAAPAADPAATAWILSATALVLFMTLPGLALFYAGLVRSKNVLSVMMHCVGIACLASVLWLFGGYSLAFSGTHPLVGDLAKFALVSVGRDAVTGALPESVFFGFQMTFAIITPALIVGAFVERIKFSAVMLFSGLWLLVVYAPVCHWVWGGGWLASMKVMDYAGGLVVHATAGVSALVIAWRLGPRDGFPRDLSPPHNPGMTMMGAAMLWVGWYGFNAGSALAADGAAGSALIATHLSAATAGLVWALIEWVKYKRASMIGLVTGVVAGLATVTPASGFVGPLGGVILGAVGSFVCYQAVDFVKSRLKVDDSLDVFAVHGVGGILGTLLVAVLAAPELGGAGYAEGVDMGSQALTQVIGVAAVSAWSAVATLVLVFVVRRTVGLRASAEAVEDGLDLANHGERAYP